MVIANLNRKNRLVAMLVDHLVMTFVILLFGAPAVFIKIVKLQHAVHPVVTEFPFGLYDIFAFSLYFCKDIFLGRSVAKRILGFQVVNDKTGLPAGPLRCLVRNFTLLIWPIEIVVALVLINRRMGDYLAGTRLEVYNPKWLVQPDWRAIVVCIPLAMAFLYVFCVYPMELFWNSVIAYR